MMVKNQTKISIIIADDHPMFRSGVRTELEKENSFNIIGETGDGKEAMKMITELKPDVAVLDIKMPGLTGIDIASRLKNSDCKTKIVLLTMYDEKSIFLKAVNEGIEGYLLKDDAISDVISAVKTVVLGKRFISNSLAGALIEEINSLNSENHIQKIIHKLSAIELKILLLIADLKTNDELSELLFVSKRTIENYKFNLAKKLELSSARDLLKFAVKNKRLLQSN